MNKNEFIEYEYPDLTVHGDLTDKFIKAIQIDIDNEVLEALHKQENVIILKEVFNKFT